MKPYLCLLLACLALFFPSAARAQSGTVFLSGKNLDFLSYFNGVLFWKAGCLGVGPASIIERTPSGSPAVATYYGPPTCDGFSVRSSNVAMDAARNVYWATGDGRIVMLDAGATPASTPVVLSQMASTALPQSVHISLSPSYVYWAETFGKFSEGGSIYRAPLTGGARQLCFNLNSAGGGGVVTLHALGNDGFTFGESIAYKRSFGKWARATEQLVFKGQPPSWPESTIVNSIDTFKVVGNRMYYAEIANGVPTLIRSRNVRGLANVATHATLSTIGSPMVTDLTADSTAVYWRESRDQTGPLWRQMLSGGSPEAITVNLPATTIDRLFLESDGRGLFWRSSPSEIRTLPVNAGAIVYDVQGRAMEVVQTIQSPLNDVPLVANKTTWVRAFGRFSVSGASTTRLDGIAFAQLHGTRNGVALPGSPVQHGFGDAALLTVDADRTVESAGSWFRLPLEWTTGTIVLRAEFNHERVVNETNFANNSVQTTVTFNPRKKIHLRVYPLRTHQGTIDEFQPEYQPVLDLAEALLPTPEITADFGGITIEEWEPEFLNPFNFGPYELSKSDDDSGWIMFKLGLRAVLQTGMAAADLLLGRTTHDIAFFRPFEQRAFNGLGRLGYPKILLSYMRLGGGSSGFNTPLGGVTLAHEMGHNYERDHVDCGSPSDPDPNYPYNDCNISDASPAYQGWNPISLRMIKGSAAGDLLSYRGNSTEAGTRWTSDYTWRAIYNKLGAPLLPPPPAPRVPRGTGPSVLLGGVVHANGTAELYPAIPLTDAAAEAAAAELVSKSGDLTTWNFALRRANGSLIRTIPAGATHTADDGPQLVYAVMDEDPQAATVILQKNNAPGIPQATLTGGGAPPTIAITAPTAGATIAGTFTLRWNASDPEGQPLVFQVRHSFDHGATWQLIADEVRQNELVVNVSTLPGGPANEAQIEVLASDGLLTASAKSAFFTIAPKAPRPVISIETNRGRSCGATPFIAAGETLTLRGSASDAEDSGIPSAALAWTVTGSTGISRTGTGRELLLRDLPPATYAVQLRATDSDNQTGTATANFGVRAFAIADAAVAPVIDGVGDDAAYLACRHPVYIRYASGAPASVRAVISGGNVYVAVTGLVTGAASPGDLVSVAFDPNNSGDTAAQDTDIRFIATRDGEFYSARGDGAGGFDANHLTTGFTVRVAGDTTRWHAEYAIPLAIIGAAAGEIVGMDVSHDWVASAGDDYHWFGAPVTAWNRPRDWADVRLASDPDDPGDLDLDGMADAWELANLGSTNTDGTGDADSDGQTDAAEFQAGTNPNDRASRFVVNNFVQEGTFLRISWPSATGSTYTVETSDTLQDWDPYCTNLPGTGNPLTCLINPALPEAGRFFRVRGQRCPQ